MMEFTQTLEDVSGGTIPWFQLKDGERKRVRLLLPPAKMPAVFEHQFRNEEEKWYRTALCLNNKNGPRGCPECMRGHAPKKMVYVILWDYDAVDHPQIAIWERTDGYVFKNLIQTIEQAGYDLTATDLIVNRMGTKLATRYNITPAMADKRYTPPDDLTINAAMDTVDWDVLLRTYLSAEEFETLFALERGDQAPPEPMIDREAQKQFGVIEE
jgi:hypothetical protein